MATLTEQDSLQYGIEYPADSGEFHYDFEVRIGTVADNIEVYEQPDIIGGGISNMRVNTAMLARCITKLGTIPLDAITPELIGTAVDTDYDVFYAAQDRLKKKRLRPSTSGETSASQQSSSASTASATNAS
ncbi:hypothetical protein WL94_20145 [Burkholderia cepacia]|uniref:hypothetical protein n=1 Tax=Burkholderia cepacia TaxID=292 RepID=UPI00075A8BB6|nr:hypothetical protein [Burkholderia cepacia]KWF84980.1 hypothetical protein WL94_20145 [Burkholderia cepacia]